MKADGVKIPIPIAFASPSLALRLHLSNQQSNHRELPAAVRRDDEEDKHPEGCCDLCRCRCRYLPSLDKMKTRAPDDEVSPRPRDDERVCFVDFVNRGFAFPVHEFFHGLMYAYGMQLHDFTPNAMLHIACFIVLCECFLGIHPHWGLLQSIFNVKRNAGARGVYKGDVTLFIWF